MVVPSMVPDLMPHFFKLVSAFIWVCVFRSIYHRALVWIALRHVRGPNPSSIIWGEEWKLYCNEPGSLYVDWHKKYGKVVKFSGAFGNQMLSITDPRTISYIVGEGTYQFPKPSGVRAWFKALLGEGILWVEGKEAHEKQRRALSPALKYSGYISPATPPIKCLDIFSPQSVRNFTNIFYETSAKMAAQWGRQLDFGPANEVEIEVTDWAGRFALDTIGRTAFSDDFNCLSGQPHTLAETLDGLTNNENSLSSFYIRALFWFFPSVLKVGKKGKMIKETRRELGDIASRLWQDAKVAGDLDDRTLMSLMLKADAGTSAQRMTEEEIAAQLRSIIQAAYEPISATIAWTLYELSVNIALQNELREELSTPGDPTFDHLRNGYPLLDAILKEVLRTHPPILENHHQAAETISVPLSEPLHGTTDLQLIIPKGTILEIPLNVLQKDTSVWGPDAELFRPHRWLNQKKHRTRRWDLFAFSDGPRVCLGKTFALAEIKALTITLVRQFSFSCPHEIESFQSFVVRPRIKGQGPSSLPLLVRRVGY